MLVLLDDSEEFRNYSKPLPHTAQAPLKPIDNLEISSFNIDSGRFLNISKPLPRTAQPLLSPSKI